MRLSNLEMLIAQDQKLLFTLTSYVLVLGIYVNSTAFHSSVFGIVASILYSLINGLFLGHAFFAAEDGFLRLTFGILLLIMLLGLVGWFALVIYNLDVFRLTFVLLVVTTLSSLLNRMVKDKNAT